MKLKPATLDVEMLEHLLLYSTLSKFRFHNARYRKIARPLPNIALTLAAEWGTGINTNEGFFSDVKPRDITGILDDALICRDTEKDSHYQGFWIEHAFKVPIQQLRGLPFNLYPVAMAHYDVAPDKPDPEIKSTLYYYRPKPRNLVDMGYSFPCNWAIMRRWQHDMRGVHPGLCEYRFPSPPLGKLFIEEYDADANGHIQIHLAHQFSIRYDWYVLVGFEELPKLKIPVEPHGVRKLFEIKAIKDPIEGRKRLIHWVVEHQRRKARPKDEDAREQEKEEWIHVCEHLRGYYAFDWRGLNCWLIPSEYDREKLLPHLKHSEIWK